MSLPPRIAAAADRSEHVRDALEAARDAHAGQIRNGSGGMPYIDHPIAVADLLAEHDYGDDVLAAALLHDVVEESEVGVEGVRERFGERVADLVEALTDDIEIEDYESRKELHRRHVEVAGPDALAIYAADKLTNIRALRRVYATQGEAVGEELKAPLDVKVAVWEADLTLLSSTTPDLPFLSDLADQLAGLRADRQAVATPETPAP
jgi:(p)ppGpp synthase/HD superfamily hydrolase